MKTNYFKTCPHCGARLDPGERCDCRKAKAEARPMKAAQPARKEGAA